MVDSSREACKAAIRAMLIDIHSLEGKGVECNAPENPANAVWLDGRAGYLLTKFQRLFEEIVQASRSAAIEECAERAANREYHGMSPEEMAERLRTLKGEG